MPASHDTLLFGHGFYKPPRQSGTIALIETTKAGATAYALHLAELTQQPQLHEPQSSVVHLNRIGQYNLFTPVSVLISMDDDEFIANAPDLPELYGCGETTFEAVEMLKNEILSLYEDLNSDEEFTEDWHSVRAFFDRILRA